tara:strand:- start:11853 stop:12371 length:519 start_codon:yes stop_codon:yes gene_type:complete
MKPWICLLGLRSSGKTTVGRELSSQLNWSFTDTDQMLIKQEGYSISELFNIFGESRFRALETQCLFKLPARNLVLATGGGIIENREAIRYIQKRAICIYLEVPLNILVTRRNNDPGDRPLLFGASGIREEYSIALERRSCLLQKASNVVLKVTCDDSVLDICQKIRRACGIQ